MDLQERAREARNNISGIKTTLDYLLRGEGGFEPFGEHGRELMGYLEDIDSEIYGMGNPEVAGVEGLLYVAERLPRGFESAMSHTLTDEEDLDGISEGEIIPQKRRRESHKLGEDMRYQITHGRSEAYDVLTHLLFLFHEGEKISRKMKNADGQITPEWSRLEQAVMHPSDSQEAQEQELSALGSILGTKPGLTKQSYEKFKALADEGFGNGLGSLVYHLGMRVSDDLEARHSDDHSAQRNRLKINFTSDFKTVVGPGAHDIAERWAHDVRSEMDKLGYQGRPVHIISANTHSVATILGGFPQLGAQERADTLEETALAAYGNKNGFDLEDGAFLETLVGRGIHHRPDKSSTHIDYQLINPTKLAFDELHPDTPVDQDYVMTERPVLLVMNYPFGEQAYHVFYELLKAFGEPDQKQRYEVQSIAAIGKAGTLKGKIGDVMVPRAFVFDGDPHSYPIHNGLEESPILSDGGSMHDGVMFTVTGTSLQNGILNEYFKERWNASGIEMEGGHIMKAVQNAGLKGYVADNIPKMAGFYASDAPHIGGHTLAAGSMGEIGVGPTYRLSAAILHKVLTPPPQ